MASKVSPFHQRLPLLWRAGGYRSDKFFHGAPVGKVQRLHFVMSQEHQTTTYLVFWVSWVCLE